MGHLHVSKMKFRTPVPDGSQSEAKGNRHHRQKTDSSDCFPVDSLVILLIHFRLLIYLFFYAMLGDQLWRIPNRVLYFDNIKYYTLWTQLFVWSCGTLWLG